MYYESVFRGLNEQGVKYLVIGGIAVNLYGIMRATADLDIMVDLSQENVEKLVIALENLGYKPKVPVKAIEFADPEKRKMWQEKKHMHVFLFFHPEKLFEEVDVFVENLIDFETVGKDKKIVRAENIEIPIISIKHLIDLKKKAGRKQDISDIEALEQVRRINEI
ncbi:hypothetical protein KAW65_03715 [candidate division WOR-3 bacterium]|nr:hypothetical protein [candidate division WOR-3 bacterium]